MENFDRLKAQKDALVSRYEESLAAIKEALPGIPGDSILDRIFNLKDERDRERRWKEAAQGESEKLALYISELRTVLLGTGQLLTDCVLLKFDRTLENRCSDCLAAITKVLNEGKAS